MTNNRIQGLKQRFDDRKTRGGGQKPEGVTKRGRNVIYFDVGLYERLLGEDYDRFNHEIYPKKIKKSVFVEAVIKYGLEHLEDIKAQVVDDEKRKESND